jgi:hypothetical protein
VTGHPEPTPQDAVLAYRVLSAVAAASYAGALDAQLEQMLRDAINVSGIQATTSTELGRAIENLATTFRAA